MDSLALEDSTKNITKMWYFPNIMGFVINVLKSVPRKWIPDENLAAALGNLDASPDKVHQEDFGLTFS